ncbi:hypothetical protein [Marinifilum flexuosum]|uniref:Uncharacterized protein n=1 Tax=Marinifilum flexuosum TaxID=1117708 RepID=A0A419WTF8_9BACT|nr:hypothetical protein [Marinifilum flexuosum]RKD98759.1 hypothetical protein BXY64_3622 [Marinifilum flexuosum]
MFDTSFGLKTWIYPGLLWGVFMFVGVTMFVVESSDELITWKQLYTLPIYLIGGLVFQYLQFKRLNKKGRREIGQKTDAQEYVNKGNK